MYTPSTHLKNVSIFFRISTMTDTTQRTAGAFALSQHQYDKNECMKVVKDLREKYSSKIDSELGNWIDDLSKAMPGSNLSDDPISRERWRIIFVKMAAMPKDLETFSVKFCLHKDFCDTLNIIYRQKNHDYGDSFAKVRSVVPNSILVRLMDKLERLKTLLGKGEQAQVIDESIDDTLMDMASYCIMELVERRLELDALNEKRESEPPKP